jgi:hypothetical protein
MSGYPQKVSAVSLYQSKLGVGGDCGPARPLCASDSRAHLVTVVAVPIMVSVAFPVPTVVVFKPATISIPVTEIELRSVVTRRHPSSPRIWWPSPISFMPFVVPSHWIPITVYPHELGAWSWGQNANNTWLRWRTNSDTDRHLSTKYRCADPYHRGKQCCPDEFSHVLQSPLIVLIKRSAEVNSNISLNLSKGQSM